MFFKGILSGVTIGVLSGFFGLGGSSVATPILRTFAGVEPIFALATPLLTAIPTAISSASVYYREKLINFKIARATILFGFPFVVLGAYMTRFVNGKFLMVSTAIFVFFVGLSFLFRKNLFAHKSDDVKNFSSKLFFLSSITGFASGFLANGGGIMLVPAYVKILKMNIKDALGTSLFVVPFFAIPGALTHLILGHVDFKLFLILTITAIPLANLSARVAVKLKSGHIELAYGGLLVIFSIYFLLREI